MALRQIVHARAHARAVLFSRNTGYNQFLNQFKEHSKNIRTGRSNRLESSNGQKKQLLPFSGPEAGYVSPDKILKAVAFTGAFGVGSFCVVSIWEYERIRNNARQVIRRTTDFSWIKKKFTAQKEEISQFRRDLENAWKKLPLEERVFIPICALNVLVFTMWRFPRMQPFMIKYFCSNPAAKAICWPMIFSTFSHYSAFHLFANMYVLHSFSMGAVNTMGREQFLGLYLTAGVFSSLTSYLYKAVVAQPGLSLGASGAIMAILAYICAKYPDTQLSILFLPMFTFSAGSAIKVIVGLDLAGVILGWRFFDHAAHLGGAAMGLFWCYYGSQHLWPKREYLIGHWHKIRGPISRSD